MIGLLYLKILLVLVIIMAHKINILRSLYAGLARQMCKNRHEVGYDCAGLDCNECVFEMEKYDSRDKWAQNTTALLAKCKELNVEFIGST